MPFAEAVECFAATARAATKSPSTSRALYVTLGKAWAQAKLAVEQGEGAETELEIKDAVFERIDAAWAEHRPHLADGTKVPKRITSIEEAYREAIQGGKAHAAAAADRAAYAATLGTRLTVPINTPAKDTSSMIMTSAGSADPAPPVDLVDVLLARAQVTPEAPPSQPDASAAKPGAPPSPVVPPTLSSAAARLVGVGTPPLRVTRLGGSLAKYMLQVKPTFTEWVESKGLSGAPLREGLTHARALDLAVHELGAAYLLSSPAEVVIRRLLSLALAHKMGNFKMATHLEELPSDSALAELPDAVLKEIMERMKMEAKIEGFSRP